MGDENITFAAPELIERTPFVIISIVVVLVVASVVGTAGNVLILYVVATHKEMWNVDSIFIVNLALSDSYVTVVAHPMSIVAKLEGEQFFEAIPGLCQTVASLCTISCVASMMTIATMSLNRYFYVCKHDAYNAIFTKRNSIFICLSLYGIGTFIVLLNLVGIGNHKFDRKSIECIWDRMATFPFTVAFSVCLVWIPSLITGVCFLKIYMYVRYHQRKILSQQILKAKKKVHGRSYRLAKTLFLIYIVFVSCWTPYALLMALDYKNSFPHELHVYITTFAHLHPSLNWLIYYLTNTGFADAFRQVLSRCIRCQSIGTVTTATSVVGKENTADIPRTRTPRLSIESNVSLVTQAGDANGSHRCHLVGGVLPTVKSESTL